MLSDDRMLALRLERQLIESPPRGGLSAAGAGPAHVVDHLCAMQAQDYPGALWSIGLRAGPDSTAADVERAIADRRIVRTWPMRGTLHFVAPADVRWMLALLSPRVVTRARKRHAELGITAETISRARAVLIEALAGGHELTRSETMALLETEGIATTGQRGYHVVWTLAQNAVLCCGPMRDRQQTFVLLDEWIPEGEESTPSSPAAALPRLAVRYFNAHGPATIADFAWWAGINKGEARAGTEGAGRGLERSVTDTAEYWMPAEIAPEGAARVPAQDRTSRDAPQVHLLPGFDEYFLGYTDRRIPLGGQREKYGRTISANGMFSSTLVIGGVVAGVWKRTRRGDRVDIQVQAFRRLTTAEKRGLVDAAQRYGRFIGRETVLNV